MTNDTLKIVTTKAVEKGIEKSSFIDFQFLFDLLKILIWPIVVIIIVLILKKTIINLINRIDKIGFAGVNAEASRQKQDNVEKGLPKYEKKAENDNIDKTLGLFSQATIDRAKTVVDNESKINEIDGDKIKIETLYRYSQALYLILSFERIYNIIFGSQLYILERVNTTNNETKQDLKRFYDNVQKRDPDFFSTYSYDDYFSFLTSNDLISINETGICSITLLGKDFLKYLVENGKTFNRIY